MSRHTTLVAALLLLGGCTLAGREAAEERLRMEAAGAPWAGAEAAGAPWEGAEAVAEPGEVAAEERPAPELPPDPGWRDLLIESGGRVDDHPFHCDHAAVHQVFDSGWMWQLRFDNGVTSLGFALDAGRMPLGTPVRLEGPFGNLTLHADATRPTAFLAGGIGITPFRSILVHAATARLPHRLFLFYSNRRPEDAAFLDEVQALERENPNYTFIGTMTDMAHSQRPWHGETGQVDQAMLARFLNGVGRPIFYIAGPPQMVSSLHEMLRRTGVTDADIRAESFTGY